MDEFLSRKAASIADLKRLAKARIPGFAWDYVAGGCNDDVAAQHNRQRLDRVHLVPRYLETGAQLDLSTKILGKTWAAPFGVAPVGLSGIVWPGASEIHARAARKANIPFILSSVSTTSIETAAKAAGTSLWFQLYPPKDPTIRNDMLRRAREAGCEVLVVTIDVPSLSRRPRDIRNGLGIPPRISLKSLYQTAIRPRWALATARAGMPQFETLGPYIEDDLKLKEKAAQIRHALREVVDARVLQQIRECWGGKLVVKGVLSVEDARLAAECGVDGIIISNHGGRQLDAASAPVQVLESIATDMPDNIAIMADSGVESGVDIARMLACGADMVFAGRAFMYGVGALGEQGGDHTIDLLKAELTQVLEQLHCSTPAQLSQYK